MPILSNEVICIKASSVGIDQNASFIAKYTENTWQKNRGLKEKTRDTVQGKNAELAVIHYLQNNGGICYIPYDDFRDDNLKKHAPFDGLLFNKKTNEKVIKDIIIKVNYEVRISAYGEITPQLRDLIRSKSVFCVEIKSTLVNYKKMTHGIISIEKILEDDFLTYPIYARSGNYSTNEYIFYAKKRMNLAGWVELPELKKAVLKNEEKYNSDIFIRVYVSNDTYYLIGYMTKHELLLNGEIKKMPRPGKSMYALYFAKPLRNGNSMADLIERY